MSLSIIFFFLLLIPALSLSFATTHFQHNRSAADHSDWRTCRSLYTLFQSDIEPVYHEESLPAFLLLTASCDAFLLEVAAHACLIPPRGFSLLTRLDVQTEGQQTQ